MSVAQTIRERLAALEPQALELVDESERHRGHAGYREGGGTHWRVSIVSARFDGQSTIERHRMVNETLAAELKGGVHALAIHASVPGEGGA